MDQSEYIEAGRRSLSQLREDCEHAAEVNEALLMGILRDNADTEIGRELGFADLLSPADFKARVPLSTYGDYEARVRRMMAGEKDVLTAYPVVHYARSSGSVGVPKNIPVSDRALPTYDAYELKLYAAVHDEWRRAQGLGGARGRGVWTTFAIARPEPVAPGVTAGPVSSAHYSSIRDDLRGLWGIPEFCIYADDPEAMGPATNFLYLKTLFSLKNREVTHIDGIFSTAVYDFFLHIRRNWRPLVETIRTGRMPEQVELPETLRAQAQASLAPDPERAEELERVFEAGFGEPVARRIWPDLEYVTCIIVGAFAAYADKLREYTGDVPACGRAYAASEALLAVSTSMEDSGHVMVPRTAYFEFIRAEESDLPEEKLRGRTLGMAELEVGRDYEVVVTNLSGLYRYRIGDVVTVLGHEGQSPKVVFKYRLSQVTNMAGEKTSMACIDDAVEKARRWSGLALPEYSIYPDYDAEPGRYVLLIEPGRDLGPVQRNDLAALLEARLEENNPSYAAKVASGTLLPLEVRVVQHDTYLLYRELMIYRGASANQLKPVRMIDNPLKERFFFALLEE